VGVYLYGLALLLSVLTRYFGPQKGWIQRTQRYPQYPDEALKPFFEQVSAGYCFKQATERAGLDWDTLHNTLLSDDESIAHSLDLCMVAGALIRRGDLPVPDRWDKLYEEYRQ